MSSPPVRSLVRPLLSPDLSTTDDEDSILHPHSSSSTADNEPRQALKLDTILSKRDPASHHPDYLSTAMSEHNPHHVTIHVGQRDSKDSAFTSLGDTDSTPSGSPLSTKDAQEIADEMRARNQSPHDDPETQQRATMAHENPPTVGSAMQSLLGLGSSEFRVSPVEVKDGNTSNVDLSILQEIATRFQPRVWVHSEEKFLPTTVESYLNAVNLYYDPVGKANMEDYVMVKEQPNEEDMNDAALFALLEAYRVRTNDARLDKLNMDNMVRRAFKMAVRGENEQKGSEGTRRSTAA